jgi:hypothetical protein
VEAKLFVESFSSEWLGLINIDNLPFLVGSSTFSTISVSNSYSLTFFVFVSSNIKNLVVVWIDEVVTLKLEDLPPSRVGAPDLHVARSTRALDIPRLVVQSSSNGL